MRIYLDNAATSFPKRLAVLAAMERYARDCGAPVGRSANRQGVEIQRIVDNARRLAGQLIQASGPERMIFAFNGTDALNLAILGMCRPGDHVVTSVLEHNSILRPLRFLAETLPLEVTYLSPRPHGRIEPTDVRRQLRPETRLVALTHASNVTGVIQPISEIGEIIQPTAAKFLVDAAQTAGHLPIDVEQSSIDLLACSGHKGLGGPLGTGLLFLREGMERELRPIRFGGTGSHSESEEQPLDMPDRYESGNLNAPGLVGLEASLAELTNHDFGQIRAHDLSITEQFVAGLRALRGVTVHVPASLEHQLSVVSITAEGFDPQILSTLLDQEFGVQTRAGLQCAARAHAWLGTLSAGGTVRFSAGHDTTPQDVDAALDALREILGH